MAINPVVGYALESLSGVLSLGTGHVDLVDSQDRALAAHHFDILVRGGETFEPQKIVAWAATHGWPPEAARELGEIAQRVKDGQRDGQRRKRKLRRSRALEDNVLVEWRKAAARAAVMDPREKPSLPPRLARRSDVVTSES